MITRLPAVFWQGFGIGLALWAGISAAVGEWGVAAGFAAVSVGAIAAGTKS